MFRKIFVESAVIVVLSAVLALSVNMVRPDGLPLVHAAKSAVTLDAAKGEISIKDAVMLFVTKRAVFIDARSSLEFDGGHVQGALSLPPDEFEYLYADIAPRLAGKEAVITYCDGERCMLSVELAKKLRAKGVKNVLVLKNGWTLWQQEKLPTEGS